MPNNYSFLRRLFVVVFLFFNAIASQATPLEIEGVAVIASGDIELARQAAIQKAITLASGLSGVAIESSERVSPAGERLESSRMRTAPPPVDYTIVREWVNGKRLHVLLRFDDIPAQGKSAPIPAYKKKIVVTPFAVQTPPQLDNPYQSFPNELMYRLEKTNKLLARFSAYAIPAENSGETDMAIRAAVRRIAAKYDGQFVVSGEILETLHVGGFFQSSESGATKRHFEIRLAVHDGLTGTRLSQHRFNQISKGDAGASPGKPFGSSDFFATPFGSRVDEAINASVAAVLQDVENIPFTARVVRIAGSKVYIDAGATSLIAPGDSLVSYRAQNTWEITDVHSHFEPVVPEAPAASISITQVYPLFSVGELQSGQKNAKVRVGDLTRFERKKEQ